ncbi:MAG: hypothetical protein KBC84_04680 [Proteobacteria bacterium]|nr:hypothetical protein [Pseudomonadota bacterium]
MRKLTISILFTFFALLNTPQTKAEPIGASPESGVSPCPVCNCTPTTTNPITTTTAPIITTTTSHTTPTTTSGCPTGQGKNIQGICKPQCNTASLALVGSDGVVGLWLETGKENRPNCFDHIVAQANLYSIAQILDGDTFRYDDYVAMYMSGYGGLGLDWNQCTAGLCSAFYDSNCNPVNANNVAVSCGGIGSTSTYFWLTTPISLIMEENFEPEDEMKVVAFNLDPSKDKQYWLWKASKKAPLLVFDPKHNGQITSATQLFGGWTFGGQKVASLIKQEAARPWRNGFDALSTMDINQDGMVSGNELEPLALWFDNNQDGISQQGEVVSLKEQGITKLFYNDYSHDSITGNIILKQGYERTQGDKTISGKAIDWFTKGGNDPFSIIAEHSLSDYGKINTNSLIANPEKTVNESEVTKSAKAQAFNGMWTWKIDIKGSENMRKQDGGLAILANDDNDVKIESITESYFESPEKIANSVMKKISMKGKIKGNILEFEARSPDGLVRTISKAELLSGNIKGLTTVYSNQSGKLEKLEYSWTATKVTKH